MASDSLWIDVICLPDIEPALPLAAYLLHLHFYGLNIGAQRYHLKSDSISRTGANPRILGNSPLSLIVPRTQTSLPNF